MIGFAVAHAVLWTRILANLKAAQDIHMDVAEAFAWGQKFQLGYGKHPPLSGWVAGAWFRVFPVADWATYALAMASVSSGLVICWLIALRVVDRRRAFFVVVMLALYPIFNFKGFKYNPDLLQLLTLPLVVLAYLNAFEKRSVTSGLWLGLAGALALMTKYWVLTMIGAIGLAALIHPAPAVPAFAGAVGRDSNPRGSDDSAFRLAGEVDFVPLTYAGDTYALSSRLQNLQLVLGYVGHNLALLALPIALAALALVLVPPWWTPCCSGRPRCSRATGRAGRIRASTARRRSMSGSSRRWSRSGRRSAALVFEIYIKTDWGISLFFLVPLALVAIPALRLPRMALFNIYGDLARGDARGVGRVALDRRGGRWQETRTGSRSMARDRNSPAN